MNVDRALALVQLSSRSPEERIEAAEFFTKYGTPDDVELVSRAVRAEDVPWVRERLRAALEWVDQLARKTLDIEGSADSVDAPLDVEGALYAATSLLLHEIEPVLGYIRLDASKEIPHFPASQTAKSIDHLTSILDAISTLRKAAAPPDWTEFDLAEVIKSCQPRGAENTVLFAGPSPFLVVGDPHLLQRAVENGLRNAVEACSNIADAKVVVNWGFGPGTVWCSIIDDGVGFTGSVQGAFRMGRTTKSGHIGWGLPIAKRAMESLGGTVELARVSTRGSCFELRWPRNAK
jgi:signal transduction histidine kinase